MSGARVVACPWAVCWTTLALNLECASPWSPAFRTVTNILNKIITRDGQRALLVVAGDGHIKDEADLAHVLHSEGFLQCLLGVLHYLVVFSGDEDIVDVKTMNCEGVVAAMCLHARIRYYRCEADSQQYVINGIMP